MATEAHRVTATLMEQVRVSLTLFLQQRGGIITFVDCQDELEHIQVILAPGSSSWRN